MTDWSLERLLGHFQMLNATASDQAHKSNIWLERSSTLLIAAVGAVAFGVIWRLTPMILYAMGLVIVALGCGAIYPLYYRPRRARGIRLMQEVVDELDRRRTEGIA